jgi:hypothetical protein
LDDHLIAWEMGDTNDWLPPLVSEPFARFVAQQSPPMKKSACDQPRSDRRYGATEHARGAGTNSRASTATTCSGRCIDGFEETLGTVAADALAILVGQQLGARLPERVIKIGAEITFVIFGLLLIVEGLR